MGLELAALVAFALTQPVLDLFGRAPDVFVYEGADRGDVLVFAVLFSLVPLAGLWVVEAAVGVLSPHARRALHAAIVATAAWLVAVNALKQVTSFDGLPVAAAATAIAAAAVLGYLKLAPVRQFLRFGSVALPAFLALFLFATPVSDLLWDDAQASTTAETERTPPVVMLLLDELPLASLVDQDGRIDPELYPGFARLAEETTWYRNATVVSGATWNSVPSTLSGRLPTTDSIPLVSDWPDNLFTVLGEEYSYEVQEAITGLCPLARCPREGGGRVTAMARRGWDLYREVVSPATSDRDPQATFVEAGDPEIGFDAFDGFQPGRFAQFLDRMGTARGPTVHYLHLLLPHTPWRLMPSGLAYPPPGRPPGQIGGSWAVDATWPALQARQRHLLQARYVDGLVSDLLDRMEETGLLDEALLVVTADHGVAFRPGESVKGYEKEEVQPAILPEMAWVPLFVRAPRQAAEAAGAVDDRNALLVDVMPTIADVLGVDLPHPVDGRSLLGPARRSGSKPWFQSHESDYFGVVAGDRSEYDAGRQREVFALGAGSWGAGEDPDLRLFAIGPRADLVGRDVDELEIGSAADVEASVDLDPFADVDPGSGTVPAIVIGNLSQLVDGSAVAVALNGRIGAVSSVFADEGAAAAFVGLVPDAWFRDGSNNVRLYLVSDTAGDLGARPIEAG